MAISKDNVRLIQNGFTKVFGDKGTQKTKGPDSDGRYSEVSIHLKDPVTEVQLRNLSNFKQENKLPHSFNAKRSGTGITIGFE